MRNVAKAFWYGESGMAAVEYALLLAFVGGTIAIAASGLGLAVLAAVGNACRDLGGPC
jgi:Flp pilus assembly pilin Flp